MVLLHCPPRDRDRAVASGLGREPPRRPVGGRLRRRVRRELTARRVDPGPGDRQRCAAERAHRRHRRDRCPGRRWKPGRHRSSRRSDERGLRGKVGRRADTR